MTALVATLFVFAWVGIVFLLANLTLGRLVRPNRPSVAKGEVYECGEKPDGTAWVQFDLRFYVVALLFIIFDVELALFFPWAVVFGSTTRAADESLTPEARINAVASLDPTGSPALSLPPDAAGMAQLSRFAFVEMMLFFGILLIGFAYLWRRGDLEWVRSLRESSLNQRDFTPVLDPSAGRVAANDSKANQAL